jgi:hypothetical protein
MEARSPNRPSSTSAEEMPTIVRPEAVFRCCRSRIPDSFDHPEVVIEYSEDPRLHEAHQILYAERFRSEHGADRYHYVPEVRSEPCRYVLIARVGNEVVGGLRLSVKLPSNSARLPLEIGDFELSSRIPELKGIKRPYCQASRFVLADRYGGSDLVDRLILGVVLMMRTLGATSLFAAAPMSNARLYRRRCRANGINAFSILTDVDLPIFPMCEGIRLHLLRADLDCGLPMPSSGTNADAVNDGVMRKTEVVHKLT